MIKVGVRIDTSGFDRKLAALKNGVPRATALALNNTGAAAQAAEEDATRSAFDRPTPFTQRAFFLSRARIDQLVARVGVKNQTGGRLSPDHWLYAEVEGGTRAQKAFERALTNMGFMPGGYAAVPTGKAGRDQYGNVGGGTIRSILSQLQAAQGSSPAPKRRRRSSVQYFAIAVGQHHGGLGPGVYKRNGRMGIQIMAFVKLPNYRKRLPFFETGQKIANDRFPTEMRQAMKQVTGNLR